VAAGTTARNATKARLPRTIVIFYVVRAHMNRRSLFILALLVR
jgi:hypothetical protein